MPQLVGRLVLKRFALKTWVEIEKTRLYSQRIEYLIDGRHDGFIRQFCKVVFVMSAHDNNGLACFYKSRHCAVAVYLAEVEAQPLSALKQQLQNFGCRHALF